MTCIFKNVGLRLLLFQECFLELYVSIFCSIILAFFLGNSNYVHLISFVFLVYLTIPFNLFFLTPLYLFYFDHFSHSILEITFCMIFSVYAALFSFQFVLCFFCCCSFYFFLGFSPVFSPRLP